ncbi:hypothetical protein EL22_28580 [Halostagnicola sp. A56]|nr:hypothetical protein EL22_28580 [Halostagnicola sp. A56]
MHPPFQFSLRDNQDTCTEFYVNRALGPLFGSIAGWANWIGLAFASAFYMFGLGEYVNDFLGMSAVGVGPITLMPAQVIGLVGALVFIGINYAGAKETGTLQIIIVSVLLAILGAFSAVAIFNADIDSLKPIAPAGTTGEVLPVTGVIFVSYLGFVQITSVAEEIKNPGKNLPRAVIGSVLIVTTIYAVFLTLLLASVPTDLVTNNETAVVDAIDIREPTSRIIKSVSEILLIWAVRLYSCILVLLYLTHSPYWQAETGGLTMNQHGVDRICLRHRT